MRGAKQYAKVQNKTVEPVDLGAYVYIGKILGQAASFLNQSVEHFRANRYEQAADTLMKANTIYFTIKLPVSYDGEGEDTRDDLSKHLDSCLGFFIKHLPLFSSGKDLDGLGLLVKDAQDLHKFWLKVMKPYADSMAATEE